MASKGTLVNEELRRDKPTLNYEDLMSQSGENQVIVRGTNGKQGYVVPNFTENIGTGNQALVFHCYGEEDHQDYIIKLYLNEMIKEEKLNHVLDVLKTNAYQERAKYVTRVLEHGIFQYENNSYHYVVMPRYMPINLSSLEMPTDTINPTDAYVKRIAGLVYQLNEGLKYLHDLQIYHGDIKPDNIMWDAQRGNLVIIDLGGSVIAKRQGQSTTGVAGTKDYLPPEVLLKAERMSGPVDYYCLGMTLAELLLGMLPKQEDELREKYGRTQRISFIFVPVSMPEYFKNLLAGLLFYADDKNQKDKLRWNGESVDKWCRFMGAEAFEDAANMDSRAANISLDSDVSKSTPGEERKRRLHFANEIAVGANFVPCEYLDELVDELAKDPESGIRDLVDGSRFPVEKIGGDIYPIFKNVMKELQDIDPNKGESPGMAFWKFVYRYGSKKNGVTFPGFPQVKSVEGLAKELYATLRTLKKDHYNFKDWAKNAKDEKQSKSTLFAVLFHNQILSTYFKEQSNVDSDLLTACQRVEKAFQENKEQYSSEIIAYMYLIADKILKMSTYEIQNVEYTTYDEFVTEFYKMSREEMNAQKALQIWRTISQKDEFLPEFFAWIMYHRGINKAMSIRFK